MKSRSHRLQNRTGAAIPQHPLLSHKQWDLLARGRIKQLTYHAVTGPDEFTGYFKHAFSVTVDLCGDRITKA